MSLDKVLEDLILCLKLESLNLQSLINLDYFTIIGINKLLYPYVGTPNLFPIGPIFIFVVANNRKVLNLKVS